LLVGRVMDALERNGVPSLGNTACGLHVEEPEEVP
jgi:hypothetical protein